MDVIQEIEYVKQEAKIVYLLECLQKTPPPVLIFAENKNDVDDIHEYLLLKGVEAVAIHGGKGAGLRWVVCGGARRAALTAIPKTGASDGRAHLQIKRSASLPCARSRLARKTCWWPLTSPQRVRSPLAPAFGARRTVASAHPTHA